MIGESARSPYKCTARRVRVCECVSVRSASVCTRNDDDMGIEERNVDRERSSSLDRMILLYIVCPCLCVRARISMCDGGPESSKVRFKRGKASKETY